MEITPRMLRAFLAVAVAEGFSAAAGRAGMVQSVLSELVAALDFAAALSVAPDAVESIQVRGQGSAVQVLVTGAGGALCEQCSPDTAAQVTMMWDGVGYLAGSGCTHLVG